MISDFSVDEIVRINYEDGMTLDVHTYKDSKFNKRIDSIYLYKNGKLEAMLSNNGTIEKKIVKESDMTFWSCNGLSQKELSDYIKEAIDLSQIKLAKHFQFWSIMERCLYIHEILNRSEFEECKINE